MSANPIDAAARAVVARCDQDGSTPLIEIDDLRKAIAKVDAARPALLGLLDECDRVGALDDEVLRLAEVWARTPAEDDYNEAFGDDEREYADAVEAALMDAIERRRAAQH